MEQLETDMIKPQKFRAKMKSCTKFFSMQMQVQLASPLGTTS